MEFVLYECVDEVEVVVFVLGIEYDVCCLGEMVCVLELCDEVVEVVWFFGDVF